MKFMMFSADGPDGIVKEVNGWLSQQTGVVIRHTETRLAVTPPQNTVAVLLFSVWYDQD
jgi:hypothetical protein